MDFIPQLIDVVLHLDRHLYTLSVDYGVWIYAILFIIIFSETGFVVTPFLPGDSLLFAVGALAAVGGLDITWIVLLLMLAAVLGNTVNYAIGHFLGPRIFRSEHSRLLNKEHLQRTQKFYEKYGGKTLIITRFLPIFRTFAPFVAGLGSMRYIPFQMYNFIGAVLWVGSLTYAGYFFGNIPWVKDNFGTVILAIIIISILPAVVEFIRHRMLRKKAQDA